MKQLGNLAIVCAKRRDVLFQVLNGIATVHIGHGPSKAAMCADWDDDRQINKIVHELNFGKYREEEARYEEQRRCG